MSAAIQIQATPDSLLTALLKKIEDKSNIFEVDDSFDVRIKLEGEQWDGSINYKIANFVIELQDKLIKIYNELNGKRLTTASLNLHKNLIINVKVKPGCTEIIVFFKKLGEGLISAMQNMQSEHVLFAILGTALIAGTTYTIVSLKKASVEKAKKIEDEETKRKFLETTEQIVKAAVSAPYMRYLATSMKKEDKMHIGSSIYTKKQAIERFKAEDNTHPEILPETFYVDDRYGISDASFEKNTITIVLNGKKLKNVTTQYLTKEDKDKLYKIYKDADIAGKIPYCNMQVSVEFAGGEVTSSAIFAIGEKRQSAITLAKAFTLAKKTANKTKQEQKNMFE